MIAVLVLTFLTCTPGLIVFYLLLNAKLAASVHTLSCIETFKCFINLIRQFYKHLTRIRLLRGTAHTYSNIYSQQN